MQREAGVRTTAGHVQGLLERLPRARDVAAQLPRVGDAGQGGVAGVDVGHGLEDVDGLVVAAELGQRVGPHPVRRGIEVVDRQCR